MRVGKIGAVPQVRVFASALATTIEEQLNKWLAQDEGVHVIDITLAASEHQIVAMCYYTRVTIEGEGR